MVRSQITPDREQSVRGWFAWLGSVALHPIAVCRVSDDQNMHGRSNGNQEMAPQRQLQSAAQRFKQPCSIPITVARGTHVLIASLSAAEASLAVRATSRLRVTSIMHVLVASPSATKESLALRARERFPVAGVTHVLSHRPGAAELSVARWTGHQYRVAVLGHRFVMCRLTLGCLVMCRLTLGCLVMCRLTLGCLVAAR